MSRVHRTSGVLSPSVAIAAWSIQTCCALRSLRGCQDSDICLVSVYFVHKLIYKCFCYIYTCNLSTNKCVLTQETTLIVIFHVTACLRCECGGLCKSVLSWEKSSKRCVILFCSYITIHIFIVIMMQYFSIILYSFLVLQLKYFLYYFSTNDSQYSIKTP